MRDGFVKVAAATPKIKVADCVYNADRIIELIGKAYDKGVPHKRCGLPLPHQNN